MHAGVTAGSDIAKVLRQAARGCMDGVGRSTRFTIPLAKDCACRKETKEMLFSSHQIIQPELCAVPAKVATPAPF